MKILAANGSFSLRDYTATLPRRQHFKKVTDKFSGIRSSTLCCAPHTSIQSLFNCSSSPQSISMLVRFQVLMTASMNMAVFWVVALCNLVDVYRRFRGACLHHQGNDVTALIMEAASTFETSVNFYQTTRRKDPKDSRHISMLW
jgi:hypothetical protein